MTTETKKLADLSKFAENFLPVDTSLAIYHITPEELFEDHKTAPILAHLAKREMEKRGFCFTYTSPDYYRNLHTYTIRNSQDKTDKCLGLSCDENEYIALWSAIEATGEK